MLTATYTIVALSVEQASVRVGLQSLQKMLQTNFVHQTALTPAQVGFACDAVKRLYESCHWRKLDMFLIPAIRRATRHADSLLDDLEELGRAAADAVGVLAIRLGSVPVDTAAKVNQFCATIDAFCAATLKRIDLEERQLFPVARSFISGESWFSIANQMLDHDAYLADCKPSRHPVQFEDAPYEQARQQRLAANLVH
jgi:hemerythrin-like domain-containing protein